jgi:hypothetical protein
VAQTAGLLAETAPKGKNYLAARTTDLIPSKFNNIDRLQTDRTGNVGTDKYHFFCEKKYGKESVTFTL